MSFNAVVQYLQERFGETYQVDTLVFLVTIQGFLVFAFVVAAFFVAGTANAGFNCVLTAFLNMAVTLGGYYVIKHSRAPIAYGFLLGSSVMMIALNIMTAVYWTKLSFCIEYTVSFAHYSCHQKSAYVAVSFFSILLILSQSCFSGLVFMWKESFIEEYGYPNTTPTTNTQFTFPRSSGYPTSSNVNRGAYAPIQSAEL